MKALYKMTLDFGRQGEVEGVFLAEKEYVDYLVSHKIEVYFGEILGKHSEVYCYLDESDIKLITDDEKVVNIVEEYDLTSGYNPLYQDLGSGTEDIPDEDVEWTDYSVEAFIDYKLKGLLPE